MDNISSYKPVLFLDDNQFMGGIIGGIAFIFANIFFRKYFEKQNIVFLGIITWCLFWWIRQFMMNFYIYIKDYYNLRDDHIYLLDTKYYFGFDMNPVLKIILTIMILYGLFYYFIIRKALLNKSVDIYRFDFYDVLLFSIVILIILSKIYF